MGVGHRHELAFEVGGADPERQAGTHHLVDQQDRDVPAGAGDRVDPRPESRIELGRPEAVGRGDPVDGERPLEVDLGT